MPLRPGPNYCSCERITLIFDIFRIGVVTGYREGMLNLFNLFGLKRLAHLSQFHIVSYHIISCGFMSCYFMSCIFMSCHLVRHFHVLQFHARHTGPPISCPAISCPANWSVNFTSVIFTSSIFSAPASTKKEQEEDWVAIWDQFLVQKFHKTSYVKTTTNRSNGVWVYVTGCLCKLSLPSLRSKLIEY